LSLEGPRAALRRRSRRANHLHQIKSHARQTSCFRQPQKSTNETLQLPPTMSKPPGQPEAGSLPTRLPTKRAKLSDIGTMAKAKLGRKVEVGFVTEVNPVPFCIIFERARPVWLLALEPSICSGVYFREGKSARALLALLEDRGFDSTLFNRAVSRLGLGCVHFGCSAPSPAHATTLIRLADHILTCRGPPLHLDRDALYLSWTNHGVVKHLAQRIRCHGDGSGPLSLGLHPLPRPHGVLGFFFRAAELFLGTHHGPHSGSRDPP
jgi:hypothetical protein